MQSKRKQWLQKGFTLIEVMVVVVILGILAAMIVPKLMSRPDEAKIVRAKQDITTLESALDLYRLDNGFYPSQNQGLDSLVAQPSTPPVPHHWKSGGYIKRLPMDPWGRPYEYRNPGTHHEIDVFSTGPEGREGEKTEIGNWD
jgi:general secretion pathway protein G